MTERKVIKLGGLVGERSRKEDRNALMQSQVALIESGLWLYVNEPGKDEIKPKHRKRGVKFCPKCGSADIYWARGLAQLWSIWECRNCGYYGAFIVEDGKLSQKLQEEYVKKHLLDNKPQT